MTIATLAYADAATRHRLAVARHAELAVASAEAKREVERLTAARAAMLNDAAEATTAGKLKIADNAIADAERRRELAEAQEMTARRGVEQAEVEALHERAAELAEGQAAAFGKTIRASEKLHASLEAARAALDQLRDAAFDTSVANSAGALFNEGVEAAAVENKTLAGLPSNLWPRVKPGERTDPIWGSITVELFERGTDQPANVAALPAGLPQPTPAPIAPAETRDTSGDRVSWARGITPPGPDSRCTACARRHWWIAPDGAGGCLTCAPPTMEGPVRKFGADFREPTRPEREPEHAVVKRGRG